jgi:hypothetical protein
MNTVNKIATAVALSLGLAVTAHAHPMGGNMGHGMGPGAQQGQHQGMNQGSMGHGGKHGGQHAQRGEGCDAAKGQTPRGPQTGQSLITPEERTAMREKMQNAKTPEERQQIAQANRAEIEKRAAEKGITLPEHRGHQGHGMGPNAAPATRTN